MARTRSENYDGIYLGILTHAAALFSAQGYMRSSIADLADAASYRAARFIITSIPRRRSCLPSLTPMSAR